jgi:hypothetical protein
LSAHASSPASPSISTGAKSPLPSAAEGLEADVAHVVQTEALDGSPKPPSTPPLSFATLVTSPNGPRRNKPSAQEVYNNKKPILQKLQQMGVILGLESPFEYIIADLSYREIPLPSVQTWIERFAILERNRS